MFTRREFLRSSSLISLAPLVPSVLCRSAFSAEAVSDAPVLVVIQLDGGNDGLNTVIPFTDGAYFRARPKLQVAKDRVHKLSDSIGLHPQMRAAKELFDEGLLTVVQSVGYPNPDRSHFRSMRIWQTASFDDAAHDSYGWLGRACDHQVKTLPPGEAAEVHIGDEQLPVALWGRRAAAMSLALIEDLALHNKPPEGSRNGDDAGSEQNKDSLRQFVSQQVVSAYSAAEIAAQQTAQAASRPSYPDTKLGMRMRIISELLKSGSPARVFYALQGGYDTHAAQQFTHAQLLSEFSQALKAFVKDMAGTELADRIVVLAFSEFGRRVQENDSQGTDHGAAGPVFLAGKPVQGGLLGKAPDLSNLDDGDLRATTDFRSVYATLLDRWLGVPSSEILGEPFDTLPLLKG